ncbi:hypothetical protein PRIPAC_84009 [Pristionchus pacificus]|uniref:Uncharacterized protein n=1 Tax=Pristionchus pacificus TaxID=54126 RepID=A0A2A6BTX1_PRIPA|nr:hypothetical protein PRIPAC_84009 [Pristionchus pacificus]|eukprot:PDM69253.1 hypothetical protein PRIPAC_47555 [Pristionchus pacificus]
MSGLVKFFTGKKKNSKDGNKENDSTLKRVNFERASTRSEVDTQQRERDRQAMRAIPNPYSVWTEPKKTRGPSSCPGVALDSTYFNERRSVRPPKQERAGSVYGGEMSRNHKQERAGSVYGGDMSGLRQYRIDGPPPPSESDRHSSHSHRSQPSQNGHRASRRYGDLSMIEERSERSDRSMQQYHDDWNRSSHRRPAPAPSASYLDYTSGDSDEDDGYVKRLERTVEKLREDKTRYRNRIDQKQSDLEFTQYNLRESQRELQKQLKMNSDLECSLKKVSRRAERLEIELKEERRRADDLTLQLSAMSTSATSNGAMERLVSSSETSLEMEGGDDEEERSKDEVHCFRSSDSVVTAAGCGSAAASAAAATATPSEADSCELPRIDQTPSPDEFELRRSFSDMGPMDGAREELVECEAAGGSWRRRRDRRSFVKRPLLPPSQESESSDGERVLLMERQVRKKGAVVKYDPNRRVPVKEKHYRRFGKPERSALDRFTFLEQEITDISGMLSSPNEGNY